MKALSAVSRAADPYRVGLELGEALSPINPEVVFLFSSKHYHDSPDLIEGLYDQLGSSVSVVGNSGDGYYETSGAWDSGASALGLSTGGAVRWHVFHKQGVIANPQQTTRALLAEAGDVLQSGRAAWAYLVSDFRADATQIEKVLESETHIPFVGGLAADDNQMQACGLYANGHTLKDAIALLVAEGDLSFEIRIGNTLQPVGRPGTIGAAANAQIDEIDGIPAMDFIERETGKPVLQSDSGVTSLTIIDRDQSEIKRLRSIVASFSDNERTLGLYGGIESGKTVQVCVARPEDLVAEVYRIAGDVRQQTFKPAAALIVSCVGRKWLLNQEIRHEVKALTDQFGETLPIAGFPSFGEIGPLKTANGYSRNLFHNMTYVVTLFGG